MLVFIALLNFLLESFLHIKVSKWPLPDERVTKRWNQFWCEITDHKLKREATAEAGIAASHSRGCLKGRTCAGARVRAVMISWHFLTFYFLIRLWIRNLTPQMPLSHQKTKMPFVTQQESEESKEETSQRGCYDLNMKMKYPKTGHVLSFGRVWKLKKLESSRSKTPSL